MGINYSILHSITLGLNKKTNLLGIEHSEVEIMIGSDLLSNEQMSKP